MKLVDRLIRRAKQTPYFHLTDYMNRYWLVPFKGAGPHKGKNGCFTAQLHRNPFTWLCQKFDVSFRIHEILRSDDARAFHDHPWPYITVILKGGYTEITPMWDKSGLYLGERSREIKPGSILFRTANSWHRLVVPAGQTAWTLFIAFKYRQKWGFLVNPDYKMRYEKYGETFGDPFNKKALEGSVLPTSAR